MAPSLAPMFAPGDLIELQRRSQDLADRDRARSLAPLLLSGAPVEESSTVSVPEQPPVSVARTGAMAEPEAAGTMPQQTPGVPGAERQVSAVTHRSLANAVGGPQNVEALMRTPEGRRAIEAVTGAGGPITTEEFDRRKRREKALLGYRQAADEMFGHMQAEDEGAPERAQLSRIKAIRAAMEGVDDPTKLEQALERETARWKTLRGDVQDRKWAAEDMRAFAAARKKWLDDPWSPAAAAELMDTMLAFKSKHMQADATHLLREVQKDLEKRAQGSRLMKYLAPITADVSMALDANQKRGTPANRERLWALAVSRHPEEANGLRAFMLDDRTRSKLPEGLWDALFPGLAQSTPKNEIQLAQQAARAAGLEPSSPGYGKYVQDYLAGLHPDRAARAGASAALTALRGAQANAANALAEARREKTTGGGKLKPETINNLTLSIKRLDESKGGIRTDTTLQREEKEQAIRDVDAQIGELRQLVGQRIAEQKGEPAAAASAAGQPPAPGTDKRRANPPPASPTKADALREINRLMSAGHSKASAAAAMRQVGWN